MKRAFAHAPKFQVNENQHQLKASKTMLEIDIKDEVVLGLRLK